MLFSDAETSQSTLLTVVMAILGTVSFGGIAAAINSFAKARSDGKRGDRVDALSEWASIVEHDKVIIEQLTVEVRAIRKMATDTQSREQECLLRCTRMESRTGYLEALLEDSNIRFRKPSPDQPGSRTDLPILKDSDAKGTP